jgi:hypothetical protein
MVHVEGPFLTDPDVRKTFDRNVHDLMVKVAQRGEAIVTVGIENAPTRASGKPISAEYIRGVTASAAGKEWRATAVVSAHAGISERRPTGAIARRVQASLAGRRLSQVTRVFHDSPDRGTAMSAANRRIGRYIGSMQGIELRAHPFADAKWRMVQIITDNAADLLKGLK